MTVSQQDKNICFKLLKKTHPELHSSILSEVQKGYSTEDLKQVAELKEVFDKVGLTDKRLFIAIVFKAFHPALYKSDNRDIPLRRGLNLQLAITLKMSPGNVVRNINEVRTWLKYGIDDLRKKADEFFEQNLKTGEEKS